MPPPLAGRGTGLLLALLAHALLVLALAMGLHWRVSTPVALEAELWAEVPRAAAPRAVEPPPEAPRTVAKTEEIRPTPSAVREEPDAKIAIEKARREKVQREKIEQESAEQVRKTKIEAQRVADQKAQKLAAEKEAKEKANKEKLDAQRMEVQEQARAEAAREANLKRIQGLANSSGGPLSRGTAQQSAGPSADYLNRVAAQIKPRINNPSVNGNPSVVFEIFLAPDGRIVSQRLLSTSGVSAWDNAVERGIIDTKVLPRMPDGSAPKSIILSVRPGD
jgi:colicin import membrane protein